ncbi:638_t:CDS:2 [Funneliformis caledonium]|uniref:mitochondrial intermediate peptidase n=1 Tax=Funneliformis caledonium TaxID=1117310 RepID=A0A9N9G7U2_9GLOM|nr:638_t:CDS:2 [Funneliformis caledonium]
MQFNRYIHSTTRLLERRLFLPRTKISINLLSRRFTHSDSSTKPDENVRLIFDDSDTWNNYTSRSQTIAALEYGTSLATRKLTGLFRNPDLATPQGFHIEAEKALRRVKLLVHRITKANTEGELRKVVKNLDRLSDALCSVIDMAEFVRTSHPDPKFAQAANWAYEYLCSYMNSLNTNTELYKVLKKVLSTPSIVSQFSSEELQVANIFLRDFEKSGIYLSSSDREQFVQLSDRIIALGRQFTQNLPQKCINHIDVDVSLLEGLHPSLGKDAKESTATLSTGAWEAQMVLKFVKDEKVRKEMYIAANSATPEQLALLEDLLETRAMLAKLIGMESYSHIFLIDKMVKNAENVQTFLRTLADHHRPKALADLQLLQEAKRIHTRSETLPTVYAWDRDFYTEKISTQPVTSISPYFSVGSVIQGLSRLFSRLYGISFEPADIIPGEVWHEDVRKLDVIDEQEGKIGIIYCDLFNRTGKFQNAAHYTVKCSRRVDDDDGVGDIPSGIDLTEMGELLKSDHGVRIKGKTGRYQLPVIVLTCDFAKPKGRNKPSLLNWVEVETLFHEMGHAMHSMIGRTDFHNVSGTRCPTDFVELPSILMEYFVYSPKVLSLFAKHHETRETIPLDLIKSHVKARLQFSAMETQSQILMALLDQLYHSKLATKSESSNSYDTTAILYKLQDTVGLFPSVSGTAWQVQFGHLFGYGAGYYSYLIGRVLAGKIWKEIFEKDPLNREAGQLFREEVLKWGGSRDPWLCVGKALRDDRIIAGDSKAVSIVGEWVDFL